MCHDVSVFLNPTLMLPYCRYESTLVATCTTAIIFFIIPFCNCGIFWVNLAHKLLLCWEYLSLDVTLLKLSLIRLRILACFR
jgi:hypothetical protein